MSPSDVDWSFGGCACISAVCDSTDVSWSGMEDSPGVDWILSVANQKVVSFACYFFLAYLSKSWTKVVHD